MHHRPPRHPRYRSLGPGQPPQRCTGPQADPPGFCIQCGEGVSMFAPQRPLCVDCWDAYRAEPLAHFRREPMVWCHGCGRGSDDGERPTFGEPLCAHCTAAHVTASHVVECAA